MNAPQPSRNRNLVEGRGRLLTNTSKKSEKSPDFKGEILYKGEVVRISGWKKITPYGELISIGVDNWMPPGKDVSYNKERTDEDIPF